VKYILVVFITAVVVLAGAYVFFKGIPEIPAYNRNPVSTESAALPAQGAPSAAPASFTTVKAGGILSMKAYSIDIPNTWTYSTTGSVAGQIDKLIISKGAYKITFTQAAMGGGGCTYPGEAPQDMSIQFNAFTEFTTTTGEHLRVGLLPAGNRAVCESQNGSWGDITEFGHIDIVNPTTPDAAVLTEINSMLSSLKTLAAAANPNQDIIDALTLLLSTGPGSTVTVSKVEGNYAKGMVGGTGGGGLWFAAKVNGVWKLVWAGNGVIFCSDLTAYPAFPKDLIPDCWDTSTNKDVTR